MTRTRNATYKGATLGEVDVDTRTYATTLGELAQDIHLLQDSLTGENGISSSSVIDHQAAGRGCALGVPLVVTQLNRLTVGASIGPTDAVLAAWPIVVPADDLTWRVRLTHDGATHEDKDHIQGLQLRILDATGTEVYEARPPTDKTSRRSRWDVSFAAGGVYVCEIRGCISSSAGLLLYALQMYPPVTPADDASFGAVTDDPYPVETPAVADSLPVPVLHDEYFSAQRMMPAYLLTRMNRFLNNAWEYLTGAPVAGNATRVHADAASTRPTTSRFHAGTRAGAQLSAEGMLRWPLFTVCFGGAGIDGAAPTNAAITTGMTYNAPIYTHNYVVDTEAARQRVRIPHMPAANSLRAQVLAVREPGKGTPTNWQARMLSSTWQNFVQIGTTQYYLATVTDASHSAVNDATVDVDLRLQRSGGASTFGELQVLGWHAYFEGA